MGKFKQADEEFSETAKKLFEMHRTDLNLSVDPSKILFLRTAKKKGAFAYCQRIHGTYEMLTNKKFFIVVVSENFDNLKTEEQKQYVILHELMHCHYDVDTEKYGILKHTLEDFHPLITNPNWNLELVKSGKPNIASLQRNE